MLLFLISSLFVLSNGVPLQLQHLNSFNVTNLIASVSAKNLIAKLADGGSAKNLIAELVDADPAKVQEVITLVEAMIGVAQNDLNVLTVTSTDANAAYIAAESTYALAVLAQTQGVTTLQTAVTDALAAKDNAEGAKTGAQSSLDAEKNRLDAEVASLQQVVTILICLSASNFEWSLTSANKVCIGRTQVRGVCNQADCQKLCMADNECIGITYTQKVEFKSACYTCTSDVLQHADNEFGYYKKDGTVSTSYTVTH